jgi:hypothetical protein
MKTYQEIFENALRRLKLSKKDVKDWLKRPYIGGDVG